MKRWLGFALAMLGGWATAGSAAADVTAASHAITELDVERAAKLLANDASSGAALERARLALYSGDCEAAAAVLSAKTPSSSPETAGLLELARGCARATVSAPIVVDEAAGLWLRLQDEADRPLVPYLTDVIVRARAAVEQDLGVVLPRPLRMDLVQDLFSLSAITGLPLEAAETTGTVAVARWGRVTMITPRATPLGYPWEDTLAHEMTHLALSRATRDHAPLWLQEGIAKREETRWREPRAFDQQPSPDDVARAALLSGRSVGVDRLGPSIAMLPTPEAASTAFAEVTSFMQFWVEQNGTAALHLLLQDLKGLGPDASDKAMSSVTGYDLAAWIRRWQKHLLSLPEPSGRTRAFHQDKRTERRDAGRQLRLADLLFFGGHPQQARQILDPLAETSHEAAIRYRAARAALVTGDLDAAAERLGRLRELDVLHGVWSALNGRLLRARGGDVEAGPAFRLGLAVDPWSEEVACEGYSRAESGAPLPRDPRLRALCEAARRIRRD